MKQPANMPADAGPLRRPGVDALVQHLEQDLERLLGKGTEYCLVVATETTDALNIQAITNASTIRAHDMLRKAGARGFEHDA